MSLCPWVLDDQGVFNNNNIPADEQTTHVKINELIQNTH